MFEEVDFDPAAAAAAAAACADAAAALQARSDLLAQSSSGPLAVWAGEAKMEFDAVAAELAAEARTEAGRLMDTAEAIDRAVVAARAEDARRVAERRRTAEQRRIAEQRQTEERQGGPR